MEWVCGVFSSSTTAAWVEAIGTVLAAGLAVLIYWFSKRDTKRQLAARRRVLHAMLREQVVKAVAFVPDALEQTRKLKGPIDPVTFRLHMITVSLPRADRLIELQENLLEFGEAGDDAIAAFIEACREYRGLHRTWSNYLDGKGQDRTISPEDILLVADMFETTLGRLSATAPAALAAIERFDKG